MLKKVAIFIMAISFLMLAGCQKNEPSDKENITSNLTPQYIDYELEDLSNVKTWINNGNPECEPSDINKLLDKNIYGSFDELMSKVKKQGLIIPKVKNIKEIKVFLADEKNLGYDICTTIRCLIGDEEYYFATFMTYLNSEEMPKNKEECLSYFESKYGKLIPKNSPEEVYKEYEDKTYHKYNEFFTFEIDGKEVFCKTIEYIEEEYTGGNMIFIYDDIQVVIQKPHSDELMQKALNELYFETVVP